MGRYSVITGEFADLMLGYYGTTPGIKDPDVLEKCEAHAKKEPIKTRPADLLKPEWDQLRAEAIALPGCNGTDEDVLTFAMFPKIAPKFFTTRDEGPKNVGKDPGAATVAPTAAAPVAAPAGAIPPLTHPVTYKVSHRGAYHMVTVEPAEKPAS
jgi:methylmalonyl-CoA carboxyltransferase 5S subunit